jgi:hypothetical protein
MGEWFYCDMAAGMKAAIRPDEVGAVLCSRETLHVFPRGGGQAFSLLFDDKAEATAAYQALSGDRRSG